MSATKRTRPGVVGRWARWALLLAVPGWAGQGCVGVAQTSVRSSAGMDVGLKGGSATGPPATTTAFPLNQVRPGLKGVAYTVFEGVLPEPMEVEILGRLRDALGPGRDMILARLHGPKPEYTGVVAGMSGSPVYVDGKLLGALSYRIGQFSKDPIAGITPIGQMLEVRDLEAGAAAAIGPERDERAQAAAGMPEMRPMESPLVFGGFSQEAVTRFGGPFRAMGLLPVSGVGGMDAEKAQPEPLEPGSAVSAVLVDGDLSITGTCTVSYMDAKTLMACGHPITQSGAVDLPMAKAEVLATLASPLNSFKIVNATQIVGAFTEDRASAILGRVGARAHMIPVTIQLTGMGSGDRTVHLGVANHRELTPQLMIVSLYQTLQQTLSGAADTSYRMTGEIRLARQAGDGVPGTALPPVKLDGWMAPSEFNGGAVTAAIGLGLKFQELFGNAQEQPVMTGVDVRMEVSPRRRTATLASARLLTTEAKAGDAIELEAVLDPYQRPEVMVPLRVVLPKSLEPGVLRVLVSDGATVDRLLAPVAAHEASLADTVTRLNDEHPNDRVYVTLLDRNAQAVLDARALSEVPLSVANVLEPLKGAQRLRLTGESAVELGSMAAGDAVSGSQVLSLTIR